MSEIRGLERIFSLIAKKKFGQFNQYGTSQYGWSHYGDEDIYFDCGKFGKILLSGIYRTDNAKGYLTFYREPYYITRNPRTPTQQGWRSVFAQAVFAWQQLTPEEKEMYNRLAKSLKMSGYNLFISEYLRSH